MHRDMYKEIDDIANRAACVVTLCFFGGCFLGLFSFVAFGGSALTGDVRGTVGSMFGFVLTYVVLFLVPRVVRQWEREAKNEVRSRY